MIAIEKTKAVIAISPLLVDNATATAVAIDTLGYKHLRVYLTVGVTDIAMTAAPKLQDCATSGGSYADITGAVLTTTPAADADESIYALDLDLRGTHERYIKIVAACGDGTAGINVAATAILSRPDSGTTTLNAGLTEVVAV